jgi:hypothetical protein
MPRTVANRWQDCSNSALKFCTQILHADRRLSEWLALAVRPGPPGTQSGAGRAVLSRQLPHELPPAWDGAARASVEDTNDHRRLGRLTPGQQG